MNCWVINFPLMRYFAYLWISSSHVGTLALEQIRNIYWVYTNLCLNILFCSAATWNLFISLVWSTRPNYMFMWSPVNTWLPRSLPNAGQCRCVIDPNTDRCRSLLIIWSLLISIDQHWAMIQEVLILQTLAHGSSQTPQLQISKFFFFTFVSGFNFHPV